MTCYIRYAIDVHHTFQRTRSTHSRYSTQHTRRTGQSTETDPRKDTHKVPQQTTTLTCDRSHSNGLQYGLVLLPLENGRRGCGLRGLVLLTRRLTIGLGGSGGRRSIRRHARGRRIGRGNGWGTRGATSGGARLLRRCSRCRRRDRLGGQDRRHGRNRHNRLCRGHDRRSRCDGHNRRSRCDGHNRRNRSTRRGGDSRINRRGGRPNVDRRVPVR